MNGGSVKEIYTFIALLTTIIGLLPQIYKNYRTKSVNDLSMIMLINYAICSLSWIAYGALITDQIVTMANIFCLFSVLVTIFQKIFYSSIKN